MTSEMENRPAGTCGAARSVELTTDVDLTIADLTPRSPCGHCGSLTFDEAEECARRGLRCSPTWCAWLELARAA